MNSHKNLINRQICDKKPLDDVIIEVNWQGEIVWEWNWIYNDHFDELGFTYPKGGANALEHNLNLKLLRKEMRAWMLLIQYRFSVPATPPLRH